MGTNLSGSLRFGTRATFAESARAGGGARFYAANKLNDVQYFPDFPMDFGGPEI